MRRDLLALSDDDLVLLSNVGLVKRARRELDAGDLRAGIEEDAAGAVTVSWSDGPRCTLPAGGVVGDGRCSCGATTVCRHLLRSVLAYQRARASTGAPEGGGTIAPWDPGSIADDELAAQVGAALLRRAVAGLAQGLLVELVRAGKPTARFHTLSLVVRFLVPGDARYVSCDCGERPPCVHAPMAVLAFRELPAERGAGYVATRPAAPPPLDLLDEIEVAMAELIELGIADLPGALRDRLRRLQGRCDEAGLVWPAEIVAELVEQHERYAARDARFSPERTAELVGELLLRSDAIRRDTGAVPQLLVRGLPTDRETRIGAARFIGLGCGARPGKASVELSAYLQDSDSGSVVAVTRDFPDPPPSAKDEPLDLWRLAAKPAVQGTSLAALGAGQLLVQGARRTARGLLHVARARTGSSYSPQACAWESLRAPLLADAFAEIRSRLEAAPCASLRPRRVAEDLHVCRIAGVEEVCFDGLSQQVQATLLDESGGRAALVHPYTSRGAVGCEALLSLLQERPEAVRFVAGPVRLAHAGLVFTPLAVVYEAEPGRRAMLQPWVEPAREAKRAQRPGADTLAGQDTPEGYPHRLLAALGELLLLGVRSDDALRLLREARAAGEGLGFARLVELVARLVELLEQRRHAARWDARPAATAALELAVVVKLALELA